MAAYTGTLPAQTAGGGTSTTVIGTIQNTDESGGNVAAVTVTPPSGYATVTGVATNNYTLTVRQLRAGSVQTASVATITGNSGTNLVAETPVNIPLGTAVNAVQVNDVFDCQMIQNGTGLALGAGLIVQVDVN